jgi:hypothetical protein
VTEFKREDPRHKTGAIVEIVEVFPARYGAEEVANVPVIKAHHVYINGTPVGLITRDDGIVLDVDPREDNATILNLRLMPRQVLVRGVTETPEQTVFDGPVDLGGVQFVPVGESGEVNAPGEFSTAPAAVLDASAEEAAPDA